MKLDHITSDDAEALRFPGSPANGNTALRTLSRMLRKAKEWKFIRFAPEFKLFKETGWTLKLDDEAESKLLPHASQPLHDIIVMMRDTGMRNGRELYRMRIENINWTNRVVFNPDSKTAKGRRFIPLSDRVLEILKVRWVFPGRLKGKHICYGMVNQQWLKARRAAGLPEALVLYAARDDSPDPLSYRTWKSLESEIPTLSWKRNWDKCERLRQGLLERFICNPWPKSEFLRCMSRPTTLRSVLYSCRDVRRGEEFVAIVAEGVFTGSLSATEPQTEVLRDSFRRNRRGELKLDL